MITPRQTLIETIHDTIALHSLTPADIVFAMAQVMTDVGVSLWANKKRQPGLTNQINPETLQLIEQTHYSNPGLDTSLIINAALMIAWVEDESLTDLPQV